MRAFAASFTTRRAADRAQLPLPLPSSPSSPSRSPSPSASLGARLSSTSARVAAEVHSTRVRTLRPAALVGAHSLIARRFEQHDTAVAALLHVHSGRITPCALDGSQSAPVHLEDAASTLLFAAVCDGYGTAHVSTFLSQSLPRRVLDHLARGLHAEAALSAAIAECDAEWRGELDGRRADRATRPYSGGSTCTAALVSASHVSVARVGDSPSLMSRAGAAVALLDEALHTPANDAESARIVAAGGRVGEDAYGVLRVCEQLMMTRAVGDVQLQRVGVVAEAATLTLPLLPSDALLLLLSDGVSSVSSPQDLVSAAHRAIAARADPHAVARAAVENAVVTRGAKDNATALVVRLPGYLLPVPDYSALLHRMRLHDLFARPVTYAPEQLALLSSGAVDRAAFLRALFASWDSAGVGALSRSDFRSGLLSLGRRIAPGELDTLWRVLVPTAHRRDDRMDLETFLARA